MSQTSGSLRSVRLAILLIAVLLLGSSATSQSPQLLVRVNDTTAHSSGDGAITVSMANYLDSVAGFQIWIQLDRPDLIYFPSGPVTIVDTFYWHCRSFSGSTCVDSEMVFPGYPYEWSTTDTRVVTRSPFDTAGTLISGWEYVTARSISGTGYDIKITALADELGLPTHPALPPQSVEQPLVRLPFLVHSVPDTLTERIAHVLIQRFPGMTDFARPNGTTICDLQDTICFQTHNGSVTIEQCHAIPRPGEVNGDLVVTAADLAALEQYVESGIPLLTVPFCADLNGDCCIGLADVQILSDYLNQGIPIPSAQCVCPEPSRCCCLGIRGNVDGDEADLCDVSDLSVLVDYLFFGAAPLVCADEADFDASTSVDISDLSSMVDYLFFGGSPASPCL